MKYKKRHIILSLFLIVQILIIKLIKNKTLFIENDYSKSIYLYISKTLRYIFGWVPFSVGDILYTILSIYLLTLIFKLFYCRLRFFKLIILKLFATFSVVFFIFNIFWGLNYYRLPLNEQLGFSNNNYTEEQLITITKKLILKTNALQEEITNSKHLPVVIPHSTKDVFLRTKSGFAAIHEKYDFPEYIPPSVKTSIYSTVLSYMGFSGYLNPFTNEAQVNYNIPIVSMPSTTSHEIAHQLGYAAENEANFISFLACTHSEDIFFQFSGYYMAMRYCISNLYRNNPEAYDEIKKHLNVGVIENMKIHREMNKKYDNDLLEPFIKDIYNGYLKANNQKNGIKSYSVMVKTLINYHEKNPNF
ncbi:DUF3810 domain-containing protein [Aureivirga sp. CE67]|uniref:DUF3810 domain-containing protein n=1 Tax=Aureivirga sp. CE67 TaxID=1788983 RepID=UPI0018CA4F7C|nr:DUF3810 domain-containing protein [Aureivirga sp. CE67]